MLKHIYTVVGFSILLLPGKIAFASCRVRAQIPASARIFAATDAQSGWTEYKSIKAAPELGLNGGESAQFWRESDGHSSVYMIGPAEDFWTYTRYCFDGKGQLSEIGFEFRTAWGWGYKLEGSVIGTVLRPNSSQYFSTESGKPVSKPNGASDLPDALKPVLYFRLANLPFAKQLSDSSVTIRK